MKLRSTLAAAALAFTSAAWAAGGHDHAPLHGGIVVETRVADFELVAKPASVQLYLRDHGKPIDVSQAKGKLTLLSGTGKQEVELHPAGGRLEANGSFKLEPGTKAVVVVTVGGKPATARFTLE